VSGLLDLGDRGSGPTRSAADRGRQHWVERHEYGQLGTALLRELRDTRAAQQLNKHLNRLPAVGPFEEFLRFTQKPDEFRFGRQDDLFDDRGRR